MLGASMESEHELLLRIQDAASRGAGSPYVSFGKNLLRGQGGVIPTTSGTDGVSLNQFRNLYDSGGLRGYLALGADDSIYVARLLELRSRVGLKGFVPSDLWVSSWPSKLRDSLLPDLRVSLASVPVQVLVELAGDTLDLALPTRIPLPIRGQVITEKESGVWRLGNDQVGFVPTPMSAETWRRVSRSGQGQFGERTEFSLRLFVTREKVVTFPLGFDSLGVKDNWVPIADLKPDLGSGWEKVSGED
ncbi:MAG: hypothetical protein MUC92_02360 [Fimbriimonadaceae bacterium]|nr:hypothetical protein [Fimbriimonadaceae bacterium]